MTEMGVKTETREWLIFENKGEKICSVLHLPAECPIPPPVVVTLHGFASSKLGTNRSYVKLAEKLTEAKIAVCRFDFRGSGDSEGDLSQMSMEDLISDAMTVYKALENLEIIDSSKMAIFGSSLGGTIAVASAVQYAKMKAMALWAPVATGELWLYDWLKNNPAQKNADPKKALASYRGISLHPSFQEQFGKISAPEQLTVLKQLPLLHFHGENDATISILHQQVFRKCRENAAAESIFITYPEAEHALGYASVFPQVVNQSVDWFKKHLL